MSKTTTPQLERRIFAGAQFRDVPGSNGRQKWATAVTYNTVDSYGTLWRPGVFDEALREKMPVILYGHDWYSLDHVLGRGIDFRQTPDGMPPGVDVLMEFAEGIPAADLALKLLAPGATTKGAVLRDVSVGFERREWARRQDLTPEELKLGAEEAMIRAGMDELSLVVAGAVPGAQVRSRLSIDDVVELAKRRAAGELSDAEAQAALDLLAGGGTGTEGGDSDDEGSSDEGEEEPPAFDPAAFDEAIETALGRSRRR